MIRALIREALAYAGAILFTLALALALTGFLET